MNKKEVFAVIWCDFVPLSLPFPDGPTAVDRAQQMHARATLAGIHLHDLRAVRLPPHIDEQDEKLETLWRPDDNSSP